MRILASNPDTIGDMVLRQPLYAALSEAGHELMLIVRPSVESLVPYVAPRAQVLKLPLEVYRDDLPLHWDEFAALFHAAREFSPDVLLVAPYRWTLFEEKLAEQLPAARRFGMNGRLYAGDPHAGHSPLSNLHFDVTAQVDENQPDVEKYALLAAQMLGEAVRSTLPRLIADESSLKEARGILGNLGLDPGEFLIAAVAGTVNVPLKQWHTNAWAQVLAHWSQTYDRRFLFIGLPEEREVLTKVHDAMGSQSARSAVWAESGGGVSNLLALTSLSRGYTGHDSGPMHLAAATGKPVLAVFGGGTWPRFVPAVEPSCAITVGVPCAGCGWVCAFARPHCIEDVPVEEVKRAVEDLETGKIVGRDVRVLPANGHLQSRMLREAAEVVRLQIREVGEMTRRLKETRRAHEAEIAQARYDFDSRVRQIDTKHERESARLTLTVQELEKRVAALEPPPKPVRQPWKVRIARRIAGKEFFVPWRGFRSLPKISIVTPVKDGREWIRQTIESVLGQDYPDLEYIIIDGGSTDGTLEIIDAYRDRISRLLCEPDGGMYDAVAKGFEIATGDVLGYLNCDDLYEPGGLMRAGEYFRDHPRAKIIYHEDTVDREGWRFANVRQPRVDVYKMLSGHTLFQDGVFFRRSAYKMVGGINRTMKFAGDWDLWVRMARMFGLRRVEGHVSSFRIRKGQISENRREYDAELNEAKKRFLTKFGLPGRIRCRVIRAINAVRDSAERLLQRRRLFWPVDYCGKPYPPGKPPPMVPGQPLCPLTGKPPDRLLFSTRDTRFGDERIHYVYYDSATGMALAYPPMSQHQLNELYEKHYSQPLNEVIAPDPNYHSPYRNYRGGNIIARNLSRLPSPWWWFQKITYDDAAADEIIRSVRNFISSRDTNIRFLDVGCFEGDLLEQLKTRTRWQLFGLEANAKAVDAARAKGHQIWQAAAEDAPLVIPEGRSFDLIFLGQTMEHLDDPLAALNRLKLLLAPGGAIALSVPNLDSKQVELFGPTWAHWHLPYHRTLLSRRALREMARLASMRVQRLRTRTHPYWTTMTVQLNRLGLGAVVPHTAYFPNVMSMHGVRLTGWCRLLWDWCGRGDYIFAVLREI